MLEEYINIIHKIPNDKEIEKVKELIEKNPEGLKFIEVVDGENNILVVEVAPLVKKAPFPTLFWLCDPRLIHAISTLEQKGIIKQWEQELLNNPEMLKIHLMQQESYINERWKRMSEEEKQEVKALGYEKILLEKGIGGIANKKTIRCLHLHYAHHLATGNNSIGKRMDDEFAIYKVLSKKK